MSDILEVRSHCESELEDAESSTTLLKHFTKRRRGRGFDGNCESELHNIHYFESVETNNREAVTISDGCRPQKSVEGWVLFVTGLHEEVNEDDVKELFSEYGCVTNISVNIDRRTGFLKGYALIEYRNFRDAEAARLNLDGSQMLNRTIAVDWGFVAGPNLKHHRRH